MLKEVYVPVVYLKDVLTQHQKKLGMDVAPKSAPIHEGSEYESYEVAKAGLDILMNSANLDLTRSGVSDSEDSDLLYGQIEKRFKWAPR